MTEQTNLQRKKQRPPIILLGGSSNALSVARSLSKIDISVFGLILTGLQSSCIRYSRYLKSIPIKHTGNTLLDWANFLLGDDSKSLRGSVLLPCCDLGIELLITYKEAIAEKYLVVEANFETLEWMLNKLTTYQKALEGGIPTPKFWNLQDYASIDDLEPELIFPLIIKPVHSHKFQESIKKKHIFAENFEQLTNGLSFVKRYGLDVYLVEFIPGGDDKYCSYYTYIDKQGSVLVDFTKRIIRRFPMNAGCATYHITDWNPEVRDMGLHFFRHVGLRGIGNIEFKKDERDGKLKIIECNPRLTGCDPLIVRSGIDLGSLAYNETTGVKQPLATTYTTDLRQWHAINDFYSFLELRRNNKITFSSWVASIMHPQVLPYFTWSDPLPSLYQWRNRIIGFVKKRVRSLLNLLEPVFSTKKGN